MQALKDLFASERGFMCLVIVVAATVLTSVGKMTIDQWKDTVLWIFGIYAAGKTITGVTQITKGAGKTDGGGVDDGAPTPVTPGSV